MSAGAPQRAVIHGTATFTFQLLITGSHTAHSETHTHKQNPFKALIQGKTFVGNTDGHCSLDLNISC